MDPGKCRFYLYVSKFNFLLMRFRYQFEHLNCFLYILSLDVLVIIRTLQMYVYWLPSPISQFTAPCQKIMTPPLIQKSIPITVSFVTFWSSL